jgi:hypothetical protein
LPKGVVPNSNARPADSFESNLSFSDSFPNTAAKNEADSHLYSAHKVLVIEVDG